MTHAGGGTDEVLGTLRITSDFRADRGVLIKEGGVIDWDSGDVMLIQAGNILTITGKNQAEATVRASGGVTSSSPTAGIGYATGAGGSVAQVGSKQAEVALHTVTGRITLSDALLDAHTTVSFNFANIAIGQNDILVLSHVSGGTLGGYVFAATPSYGEALVSVRNVTPAPLSEEIVIAFAVIKAAVA